nr:EAL domain-containing protein [Wenzhouxiangella sp. XN79A]
MLTPLSQPISRLAASALAWITIDLIAVAVSAMIAGAAWLHYLTRASDRIALFGALFAGVFSFELVHALQVNLLDTTRGHANGSYWFGAARTLAGMVLIAAALPERWFRALSPPAVLLIGLLAWLLLLTLILLAPAESTGRAAPIPTPGSMLLIALYLSAAALHAAWLLRPAPSGHAYLVAAGVVLAFGEAAIATAPADPGVGELLGHAFRVIGALFLIRALLLEIPRTRLRLPGVVAGDPAAGPEQLPDLLAEIDRSTRILHLQANPPDVLTGAAHALRGRRLDEILPDEAVDTCRAALAQVERSGIPQRASIEVGLPAGRRRIEVSVSRRTPQAGGEPTFTLLARSDGRPSTPAATDAGSAPSRLNAALLELHRQSASASENELLVSAASMAEQLTRSPIARLFRIGADGRLTPCTAQTGTGDTTVAQPIELARAGVWADGLRQQRPIVSNQPAPEPEAGSDPLGQLMRWISLPVSDDDEARLLLVVGNRDTAYCDRDVLALQVLANAAWSAVKRKRQDGRLRLLSIGVDQSPNPILITDARSRIEYVNAAFEAVTGYTREEVIGQNPSILASGQTPESTYRDMWQTLSTGQPWRGELINQRKNGQRFLEQALIYPVRAADGQVTHYLAHIRDITERREIESRVDRLTRFDQLTGLPNRTAIEETLEHLLSAPDPRLAVLWINLDNFKLVNESLGRDVGNLFLLETANRLRVELDENALLGRQSGDSFLVALPRASQSDSALCAHRLMDIIQTPTRVGRRELAVTASVGAALAPDDADNVDRLLRYAEAAMYDAKREGRNNLRFYSRRLQSVSERTLRLISGIGPALQRGEMRMVYQPQMNLADGRLIGAEALIRWRHAELGDIPPSEFIPLAEQGGLINTLGGWVIDAVTHQARAWRDAGLDVPVLAINLSASQVTQHDLIDRLNNAVDHAGIAPQCLELELTEAAALKDPTLAEQTIGALSENGFSLAIDDFGSGYSSMNYLKRFAVNCLKIDAAFIQDLESSQDDRAIVRAIIQLAHSLGMRTVAEGVERGAQVEFLREQGCDAIQGYWFARPLEVEAFETFCRNHDAPD